MEIMSLWCYMCDYRGRIVGRSCSTASDSGVCMWLCLSWHCDALGAACMLKTMHALRLQCVARKSPGTVLLVLNGCFVREEWRFVSGCAFSLLGSLGSL